MQLLFVADLHYALKQFDWLAKQAERCDVLIIGGDLLDLGGALDIDVQVVVVEKYLLRLSQLTRVVICSGNHDGDERDASGESRARWLRMLKNDRLHVDGESIDLNGLRITICPWWDGPVTRAEVEQQLVAAMPSAGTYWLWVNHSPPEGPLGWNGKKIVGDAHLNAWVERLSPDMVLSGHVHNAPFFADGAWVQRMGKTWAFNPGRQIGPRPTSLWIDLEKRSAEWQSLEGSAQQTLA